MAFLWTYKSLWYCQSRYSINKVKILWYKWWEVLRLVSKLTGCKQYQGIILSTLTSYRFYMKDWVSKWLSDRKGVAGGESLKKCLSFAPIGPLEIVLILKECLWYRTALNITSFVIKLNCFNPKIRKNDSDNDNVSLIVVIVCFTL